jgi:glycosyltransferase involved in cell wall biosynthesis
MTPNISIVVPVYNEEDNLPLLYAKTVAAMDKLDRSWELILVDDGSRDRSPVVLEELAAKDDRLVVVELRRNFGQTAAIAAGFHRVRGQAIITMDSDLQNDPEDISAMLELYDRGYDVVSGWRKQRQDGFILRTLPSRMANWLISKVTGVHLHDYGCTLKVYRPELVKSLNLYGEMHRFLPALMFHQGARVTEMEVHHHPRVHGVSKYGLGRTTKVILDLLTVAFLGNYLTKPSYLFGWVGMTSLSLGGLVCVWMAYLKFFKDTSMILTPLPMLSAMLVILGVQFMGMGLLAELQVRTYHESQQKPTYVVRRVIGGAHPQGSGSFRPVA